MTAAQAVLRILKADRKQRIEAVDYRAVVRCLKVLGIGYQSADAQLILRDMNYIHLPSGKPRHDMVQP
jgi:hypothetical protein